MATKKKRSLGRGFEALLGDTNISALVDDKPADATGADNNALRHMPIEDLQPGRYQPRRDMRDEALQALAESIKAQGIIQPIVIRPIDSGGYEIIAGERRWRAAQLASLQEVPVVIRDVDDRATIAMALIENIQREDLNPLEEAQSLQRLIDEFGFTHEQAASAVGRSRSAVSNLLRLLALSEEVKALVVSREIEMGHARTLLALPREQQYAVALRIVKGGLSVRAAEKLVQLQTRPKSAASTPAKDPNIARLESELSESIGAAVNIKCSSRGKGTLVISYSNLDQLEGILERLR
ncbi:MAG: ParB/RepB/Spo0J family partition protein [Gammaproteobacteria bacterium]|nr:ParB/RepB/Spo0J family partition protein [Gammaproteobacteria bacterium]